MRSVYRAKSRHFWLGISISVLSLAAILFIIQPAEIVEAIKTARYEYVGLCFLGVLVFLFLRAARWRFMLGNNVPFREVFHIQNIGYMLTNLLPFRIGDVARAVLIGNVPPATVASGLSTMIVERVLDMIFMVTLLPFTLAGVPQLPDWMRSAARISGLLAVGAIAILVIAANNRRAATYLIGDLIGRVSFIDASQWVKRFDELLAGLDSLTRLRDGLILIAYSIVLWIPIIFAYYMMLIAVNIDPTLPMAGFVVCAAAFSIAAPSSPGQIGVFHAGVIAALTVLGQPEAESASFAFLYHALNVTMMVLVGLLGLLSIGATFSQVVNSVQNVVKRDLP